MPGPREEAVLYVLFFMRHSAGFGGPKDHNMLILASLGRSSLSTMEELLVFSTNCESNLRDLLIPRTLTDLD
jgi:hypothetical protein